MYETKTKIDRIKGTRDVLPKEYERRKQVWGKIRDVFESFGYRGVEIPTIESLELHIRKSGESIRKNLYTFKDRGEKSESICLRPELTASVARMFNNELQKEPLPIKLYYTGSSFRYDSPQKGRYREFTQVGVELIGGSEPQHDAEIIALACKIMDALEISDYEVVIGNIGITLELLEQKKIDERVKNYIIESLEELSKADEEKKGIKIIKEGLQKMGVSFNEITNEKQNQIESVRKLDTDQVKSVIAWVIETIYGSTDRGRDPLREPLEIAENMLAKIQRIEQQPRVQETLDFISKLTQIKGVPPKIFEEVDALIKAYGLDPKPIEELRKITKHLNHFDIDWSKVKINFGFGRGLAYYTGMIFEIYCYTENLGENQKQVCGGGRYDTLINELGGSRDTPALGFSFGLERILLAMKEPIPVSPHLDAIIAPFGGEAELCYAMDIASCLRKEGLRTDIGSISKKPGAIAKLADKFDIKFVLFIGEDELSNKSVSIKDMITSKQIKCSIEQAIEIIKKRD